MSVFQKSTLRTESLRIQKESGVKYTEALRTATKSLYTSDFSDESAFGPDYVNYTSDPDYRKFLQTYDIVVSELLDTLPKFYTDVDGVSVPWELNRNQGDSFSLSPQQKYTKSGCYHIAVVFLDSTDMVVNFTEVEKCPGVFVAGDSMNNSAFEDLYNMSTLSDSTHVKVLAESEGNFFDYIVSLEGLTLGQKKFKLVTLINSTLTAEISNHISKCNGL